MVLDWDLQVTDNGTPDGHFLVRKKTLRARLELKPYIWTEVAMAAKAKASKRELIDTGTDKRYARRNEKGQFDEVVDVGRSLAQDVKHHAKTEVPPGQGDRGDQKRSKRN